MTDQDTSRRFDDHDRARCAVVARRMEAALTFGFLALACLFVASIGLAVDAWGNESLYVGLVAVLLGLVERYYALRLRLDAGLFADLASGRIIDLPALDAGLAAIGVHVAASRPLDDRIAGCRRLWRRHLAIVVVQATVTLLAVVSS